MCIFDDKKGLLGTALTDVVIAISVTALTAISDLAVKYTLELLTGPARPVIGWSLLR
jgi:hypothetical protein